MRIERLELRLLRLPPVRFLETSCGRITRRELLPITHHDASERYLAPDLTAPEIDGRHGSTIPVPIAAGIGMQIVPGRVAAASREKLEMRR